MICFIGIDGSGKTTHANNLCRELQLIGIKCIYIRPESLIAKAFSGKYAGLMSSHKNALRTDHTDTSLRSLLSVFFKLLFVILLIIDSYIVYIARVIPHLRRGTIIIYDRYSYDSLSLWDSPLTKLFIKSAPKPDVTFLLDLPETTAFIRMHDTADREIPIKYYKRLREWYLSLARRSGFIVIDTSIEFRRSAALILNYIINNLQLSHLNIGIQEICGIERLREGMQD